MTKYSFNLSVKEIRPVIEGYPLSEGTLEPPFSGKKVILRQEGNSYRPLALVSRYYTVIPNELVLDAVEKAFQKAGLSFNVQKLHRAEYISDKRDLRQEIDLKSMTGILYMDDLKLRLDIAFPSFQYEVRPKDALRYGLSIRNSLDGTSAFAVDAYSLRLICLNGAVSMKSDFSVYLYHRGDKEQLLEDLYEGIERAINHIPAWSQELHTLYIQMAETKLTMERAEKLLKLNLPDMYYTSFVELEIKECQRKRPDGTIDTYRVRKISKLRKEDATLWDVFNDITEKITHKSRVGIIRRSILTDALHRFMKRLINSN